jgi:hypothetical protein
MVEVEMGSRRNAKEGTKGANEAKAVLITTIKLQIGPIDQLKPPGILTTPNKIKSAENSIIPATTGRSGQLSENPGIRTSNTDRTKTATMRRNESHRKP